MSEEKPEELKAPEEAITAINGQVYTVKPSSKCMGCLTLRKTTGNAAVRLPTIQQAQEEERLEKSRNFI